MSLFAPLRTSLFECYGQLVLTHLPDWSEGKVIDVENNTYNGIVVSAETDDGSIYFQRAEYFKKK